MSTAFSITKLTPSAPVGIADNRKYLLMSVLVQLYNHLMECSTAVQCCYAVESEI